MLGSQRFGLVEDLFSALEQGITAVDGFGGALDHGIAERSQFFLIQGGPAFGEEWCC